MAENNNAVVITIDGPSGAGKGTISRIVAKKLGFLLSGQRRTLSPLGFVGPASPCQCRE